MERDQLLRRVAAALTDVRVPGGEDDVFSSGRVRDLRVDDEGVVRFRFGLRGSDPGTLVREARAATERVDGVTRVKIDVGLPAAASGASGAPAPPPGAGSKSPLRPGSVPAPTPQANTLPGVAHIIAVSSGKGGVGKSTVAVNLAAGMAAEGKRIGLLDADVYGPNVPTMFGEHGKPQVTGSKGKEMISPLEAHGVRLMSLGFLLDDDQPAVMRGPLISGILRQFIEQVEWGELDVLVVDMPPGTGDAQLSLVQTVNVDGVVMVTTPQDVSTGDVRRAIKMFERVNTPVIGLVENMSTFICPCCDEHVDVFGRGGGRTLAEQAGVPLLAEVPLEIAVRKGGDEGTPAVVAHPDSAAGRSLRELAQTVLQVISEGTPQPAGAGG